MAAERTTFEVQVLRGNRWVTETVSDTEERGKAAAIKFMADPKCEGVRVMRSYLRLDGSTTDTQTYIQTRTIKDDAPIRIASIDEAPPKCKSLNEYYGPESRAVMNKLFRPYMEKMFVIPTEILYNFKEIERIQDRDSLVSSAVDRIATLQTSDGTQESKSRRDELFKSVEEIASRARQVEKVKFPKIGTNFGALWSATGGSTPDESDYLALTALSRELVGINSWVGKLDTLCKLADAEKNPRALTLLDGVITDVLGANVIEEILGWQPSLASAICRMLDLAEGKMPTEKSDAGETAVVLNKLFADKKIPISRACVVERAHRMLRSPNALAKNNPSKEFEELRAVIARLLTIDGRLYNGTDTAEALTVRIGRNVQQGGATGRRLSIGETFRAMPDRSTGIIYLCDLARGQEYAKDHSDAMVEQLDAIIQIVNLNGLVSSVTGTKEKLLRATRAHIAIKASVFPEELREEIANHIDSMLESFLINEKIMEKLDHPGAHLRDRAVRLVQFCAAGVLPEGKALTRARQRILMMLRQASFDSHFVEGLPSPAIGQKMLRDFHQLLIKAGFGGG